MASLALLCLLGGAARQARGDERVRARRSSLELEVMAAPEYDTNVARETEYKGESGPTADLLSRLVWRAALDGRLHHGLSFSSSLDGGAKRFFRESQEDALILQMAASLRARLPGPLSLTLGLDTKDRRQPEGRRSYHCGGARLGLLIRAPAGWVIGAAGLARTFRYLPDHDYDYKGWALDVFSRWRGRGLALRGSVRVLFLYFDGARRNRVGQRDAAGMRREDKLLRYDLSFRYLGPILASGGLYLQIDDSNSSGLSHHRLGARSSLTISLPWGFDISLRGTLLLVQYDTIDNSTESGDPAFGVEDEETRSWIMLALRRPLLWGLEIEARYSRYFTVEEGPEYHREVFLLGLRYGAEI